MSPQLSPDHKAVQRWRANVGLNSTTKHRYKDTVKTEILGSLSPRKWRTSYDTEEIDSLLKP